MALLRPDRQCKEDEAGAQRYLPPAHLVRTVCRVDLIWSVLRPKSNGQANCKAKSFLQTAMAMWPTVGAFLLSLALAFSIRHVVLKEQRTAESSAELVSTVLQDPDEELPPMTAPTTKNANDITCFDPTVHNKSKRYRISRTKMRRKKYADDTAIGRHKFVPGSLDLLSQRGIVCPGQTLEDVLHDGIKHTTPAMWNQKRMKVKNRPVVVFKRGGSGSTWFDSTLAGHSDVKFQHEIQKYFRSSDTPKDKTDLLVDFLTTPKFQDKYRGFNITQQARQGY